MLLALAACSPSPDAPDDVRTSAPASTPPATSAAGPPAVPGIAAEAVRLRTDEAVGGQFHVRVTDTGDAPFTVSEVALAVPGFATLTPAPVTAAFVPGRVIDLPVPYGAVDCAVVPGPAAARLTVSRPDGTVEALTVPLAGDVPARVHAEECAAEAVASVAALQVTDLQARDDELRGRLGVRRLAGEEPVAVRRIGRSVLIDVRADLPLEIAAREGAADVPVTFRPATCEPHVLSETKKPYVFLLEVTLGEEPPVVVDLPVDDHLRGQLADLVRRVCDPA
ncbi:hypothetical protein DQ244_06665 [Blastococcus sp. TBT05-19]|nr:hypothetical protein DQ244_06665 [Blastococcus sp. TBT05-19]